MNVMSEDEYLAQLNQQKHMYYWCLINVGSFSLNKAKNEAEKLYKYEHQTEGYRWLIFHDDAWHWAMLKIHGEQYWLKDPNLENESKEYSQEWLSYDAANS